MGQKGQYPANFGEPHSNGTLINPVTSTILFGPLAVFISVLVMLGDGIGRTVSGMILLIASIAVLVALNEKI